ncbi:MAG: class B sortase [Oscillospiraceae bacterium]|nr:class B sortase [Oscillospiraceae bacterium]
MNRFFARGFLPVLLPVLIIWLTAACAGRDNNRADFPPPPPPAVSGISFINPLDIPAGLVDPPESPDLFSVRTREKHAVNPDTVGWLYMPNSSIDDVVVWYPHDYNEFYLRKDFEKRWSWEGSYYADFRTVWGNGTRDEISRNTVIYGHSMEDIHNVESMDPQEISLAIAPLFTEFKKLQNESFARNNPYIYFSTTAEDMIWEIFSVHYSNIHVPYNDPDPSGAAFEALIQDSRDRSIWIYDVEVGANDKILTLSTCCYNITPVYPNDYRYVVMARLMEKDAAHKSQAGIIRNPEHKPPQASFQDPAGQDPASNAED